MTSSFSGRFFEAGMVDGRVASGEHLSGSYDLSKQIWRSISINASRDVQWKSSPSHTEEGRQNITFEGDIQKRCTHRRDEEITKTTEKRGEGKSSLKRPV